MKTSNPLSALLHRVLGYARPSRAVPRPRFAPGSAQRSLDMASMIFARYAAIEHRWPAMALVFQQPNRGDVTTVSQSFHSTHPSIFLNPRVLLRLLVGQRPGQDRASKPAGAAHQLGAPASPMTLVARSLSSARHDGDIDVLSRITRRADREEPQPSLVTAPTSRRSTAVASPPLPGATMGESAPSLARVVRLAPKSRADTLAAATAERPEFPAARIEAHRGKGPAVLSQPALDIARITDQVMQALDSRIVAQRERMGRS